MNYYYNQNTKELIVHDRKSNRVQILQPILLDVGQSEEVPGDLPTEKAPKPKSKKKAAGGGGEEKPKGYQCKNCKEYGHTQKTCPNPKKDADWKSPEEADIIH